MELDYLPLNFDTSDRILVHAREAAEYHLDKYLYLYINPFTGIINATLVSPSRGPVRRFSIYVTQP